MGSLVYLAGVLGFIIIASVILAIRAREPRGIDHTVKEFRREMTALSPEQSRTRHDSRRGR